MMSLGSMICPFEVFAALRAARASLVCGPIYLDIDYVQRQQFLIFLRNEILPIFTTGVWLLSIQLGGVLV